MNKNGKKSDSAALREEFFVKLQELSPGERAALRRNAGKMISDADAGALCAFYRCLPRQIVHNEDRWFAAACFSNIWRPGDKGIRVTMQKALQGMRIHKQMSESLEKRVKAMMDTAWRSDGFLLSKLNRMIRMMRQLGYIIDCNALLRDLERWNYENHPVRREWIRVMQSERDADEQAEIADEQAEITEDNNAD